MSAIKEYERKIRELDFVPLKLGAKDTENTVMAASLSHFKTMMRDAVGARGYQAEVDREHNLQINVLFAIEPFTDKKSIIVEYTKKVPSPNINSPVSLSDCADAKWEKKRLYVTCEFGLEERPEYESENFPKVYTMLEVPIIKIEFPEVMNEYLLLAAEKLIGRVNLDIEEVQEWLTSPHETIGEKGEIKYVDLAIIE